MRMVVSMEENLDQSIRVREGGGKERRDGMSPHSSSLVSNFTSSPNYKLSIYFFDT